MLEKMAGQTDRRAAFKCVLSIAAPTGQALTYDGRCEGVIAQTPAGANGFGYDPVFFHPPSKKTFAQLSREEKSHVSHRGKALGEIQREFDKVLAWIEIMMPVQEKI